MTDAWLPDRWDTISRDLSNETFTPQQLSTYISLTYCVDDKALVTRGSHVV